MFIPHTGNQASWWEAAGYWIIDTWGGPDQASGQAIAGGGDSSGGDSGGGGGGGGGVMFVSSESNINPAVGRAR